MSKTSFSSPEYKEPVCQIFIFQTQGVLCESTTKVTVIDADEEDYGEY